MKLKNKSNFLDNCLIFHCLFEIKGQKSCLEQIQKYCLLNISRRTKVNLLSALSSSFILRLAIYYFSFCYKLSNFLAIIDGYYIWLCSDWTIWYNLISLKDLLFNIFLVFCFNMITFKGSHVRQFTQIIGKWNVAPLS